MIWPWLQACTALHCAPLNCQMLDGAVALEPPSLAGDGAHCSPAAVAGARDRCPCYPHCPHYLQRLVWVRDLDQDVARATGRVKLDTGRGAVVVWWWWWWWYADQNRHLSPASVPACASVPSAQWPAPGPHFTPHWPRLVAWSGLVTHLQHQWSPSAQPAACCCTSC